MKKSTILRFLTTYVCVLLPMLLTTVLVTQDFIKNAAKEEIQKVDSQVAASAQLIVDHYEDIPRKGISLLQSSAFSSKYVLSDPMIRKEAISLLQNIQYFNGDNESVLVYYGEGQFITPSGTVSPRVYFEKTLACDAASVARAVSAIGRTEKSIVFLSSQASGGYLLFHAPIGEDGYGYYRSVQVVTSMSRLGEMLRMTLRSGNVVFQLQIGDQVCYFHNTQDGCNYITEEQAEKLLSNYSEAHQGTEIETNGLHFRIWCDLTEQMAEFYHLRNISILLLCIGLILSVAISLALSFVRFSGLQKLVNNIRSKKTGKPARKHWVGAEMDYIQTLFDGYISENAKNHKKIAEYRKTLFTQVSMLILHGSLRDKEEIYAALKACGTELYEEYFFVLGIELKSQSHLNQLDVLLQGDIHSCISDGEKKLVFVLCELPCDDSTQEGRFAVARKLTALLKSVDIYYRRMAVSQVYSEINAANYAYLESYNIIENTPDSAAQIISWEEFVSLDGNVGAQIGNTYIKEFREAIVSCDAKKAVEVLSRVLGETAIAEDKQAKRELRYAFLQLLIAELNAMDPADDNASILEDLNSVNSDDEERFESTIFRILQKYFTNKDNVAAFDRVLRFVEENYSKYDFSLEMVAEFANCSKSQVSKLFKSRAGVSYLEYVTRLRMTKAKEMLERTDMSVKDIFCHIGYIDTTNASKKFRAYFGMNPSSYRLQYQRSKQD